MPTVTLQEARATLPELIHRLVPGEAVVITENDRPVARLVSELPAAHSGLRPPPGLGKGCITIQPSILLGDRHQDQPWQVTIESGL